MNPLRAAIVQQIVGAAIDAIARRRSSSPDEPTPATSFRVLESGELLLIGDRGRMVLALERDSLRALIIDLQQLQHEFNVGDPHP